MSLSHYQGLWPRSSDKCPPYFSQKYHKAYLLQEMSEDVRLRDTDRVFSRAIDGGCILKEYFNIWGKYASRCAGENFTENVWLAETTSCNVPIKGMHWLVPLFQLEWSFLGIFLTHTFTTIPKKKWYSLHLLPFWFIQAQFESFMIALVFFLCSVLLWVHHLTQETGEVKMIAIR